MPSFKTESSQPDDKSVMLKIIGEFQGLDALQFEFQLMGHLEAAKKRFIINLSEVPYIDSAALGLLVKCAQSAGQTKKEVVLLAPTENVMKVLDMTHLGKLFTILEDI